MTRYSLRTAVWTGLAGFIALGTPAIARAEEATAASATASPAATINGADTAFMMIAAALHA